jgi:hypothetical protein
MLKLQSNSRKSTVRPIHIFITLPLTTVLALGGCGQADRAMAFATGSPQQVCVDGVLYLQFTSGSSVKYLPDGKVATCAKK